MLFLTYYLYRLQVISAIMQKQIVSFPIKPLRVQLRGFERVLGQRNFCTYGKIDPDEKPYRETNTITEVPMDVWRIPPKFNPPKVDEFAKDGEPSNVAHHWPKASFFNRTHWRLVRPKHRYQRVRFCLSLFLFEEASRFVLFWKGKKKLFKRAKNFRLFSRYT